MAKRKRKKGVPSHTWKHVEREVADFFGSQRTPLSGSNSRHKTNSDTLSAHLYIETKYRQHHAAVQLYLEELPKARAEDKPLIVALKQRYQGLRDGDPPFLILIDPRELRKISKLLRVIRKEKSARCKTKRRIIPKREATIEF